jgi:transposase-like protein
MKKKQQASEKIHDDVVALRSGRRETDDLLEDLAHAGLQSVVQQILESEVDEHLGRSWYARSGEGPHQGYRNGYERRTLKTRMGKTVVQMPRVRKTSTPFRSKIWKQLSGLGQRLALLGIEMYIRGLSVHDIEQTLVTEEHGEKKPLLTRSVVSRLSDRLTQEYEAFVKQDLSELDVIYLFVDGVYESIRAYANNQTILAAWAVLSDGRKVMLHLEAVQSESQSAWEEFFEQMLRRGLRQPMLVISDGCKGAAAAIERTFAEADRQRCMAHKMRNLMDKLPKDTALRQQIRSELNDIFHAPDYATGVIRHTQIIKRYETVYPSLVRCLQDDWQACLVHLKYPTSQRKYIRTTNLLERCFEEEKRRTKIIPTHQNERAAMKLVFGTLLRVSQRWNHIAMRTEDLKILADLRAFKRQNENKINIGFRKVA